MARQKAEPTDIQPIVTQHHYPIYPKDRGLIFSGHATLIPRATHSSFIKVGTMAWFIFSEHWTSTRNKVTMQQSYMGIDWQSEMASVQSTVPENYSSSMVLMLMSRLKAAIYQAR